jgi:hypothetical protein
VRLHPCLQMWRGLSVSDRIRLPSASRARRVKTVSRPAFGTPARCSTTWRALSLCEQPSTPPIGGVSRNENRSHFAQANSIYDLFGRQCFFSKIRR